MKVIRVNYTTTAAFAPINQKNIAGIVAELKALNHPGIQYGAWLLPDGKSFMHFDQFESEEAHETLTSLMSFKKFDAELMANGFEIEPILDVLNLVASTEKLF